jgi:acetyltransferase-like isoleucine patch superfamily enzyme
MAFSAFIYSFFSVLFIKGWFYNSIIFRSSFLKKTKIIVKGKNNSIIIHPENRLSNCLLYISGNDCRINIDKHCILSNMELWIEDDGGQILIGCLSTMEGGHIASTEGKTISIGNDCMFSNKIMIRNGDSHAIFEKESNRRVNSAESIFIGNHVWLGADSKILKGSLIGDNCIIATGSIVTGKCFDLNSIYAGIPARKIKDNIYWRRERN